MRYRRALPRLLLRIVRPVRRTEEVSGWAGVATTLLRYLPIGLGTVAATILAVLWATPWAIAFAVSVGLLAFVFTAALNLQVEFDEAVEVRRIPRNRDALISAIVAFRDAAIRELCAASIGIIWKETSADPKFAHWFAEPKRPRWTMKLARWLMGPPPVPIRSPRVTDDVEHYVATRAELEKQTHIAGLEFAYDLNFFRIRADAAVYDANLGILSEGEIDARVEAIEKGPVDLLIRIDLGLLYRDPDQIPNLQVELEKVAGI